MTIRACSSRRPENWTQATSATPPVLFRPLLRNRNLAERTDNVRVWRRSPLMLALLRGVTLCDGLVCGVAVRKLPEHEMLNDLVRPPRGRVQEGGRRVTGRSVQGLVFEAVETSTQRRAQAVAGALPSENDAFLTHRQNHDAFPDNKKKVLAAKSCSAGP